ncbi:MAG: hypothetical protein ACWA5U_04955 [bacterium]
MLQTAATSPQTQAQPPQQALTPEQMQQAAEQKQLLIDKLTEAMHEVSDELQKGLSPDDYPKAEKLQLALKAAIDVVQQDQTGQAR